MPWFLTPHGPHFVVEPGTVDEYERRDYTPLTSQQVTDFYAGVAIPEPSFVTEAELAEALAGVGPGGGSDGGSGVSAAPPTMLSPALVKFYARLGSRDGSPVPIVTCGSSTTADPAPHAYSNRISLKVQAEYPLLSGSHPTAVKLVDVTGARPNGVGVVIAGIAGSTSASFLSEADITKIGGLDPALLVVTVGANEAFGGNVATYKTNVQAKIAALKAAGCTRATFVLVHTFQRGDVTSGTTPKWEDWGQALKEIAAADPNNCVFVDAASVFKTAGWPSADPFELILGDRLHCTAAGHDLLAESVWRAIRPSNMLNGPLLPVPVIANVALPTIAGSAASGGTLTVTSVGTWSAPVYLPDVRYQWRRGNSWISGATASTYVTGPADVGLAVACDVTVAALGYESRTAISNAITVTATSGGDTTAPTITSFTATPGDNQVALAWAASDNVAVTRYVVTRGATTVYDGTATSTTETGLTGGVAVTYTLTAHDAAGNTDTETVTATPTTPAASSDVLTGMVFDLDSEGITGVADGAPIPTWPSSGGSSAGLTIPAFGTDLARRPTFHTNQINGRPVARFSTAAQTLLQNPTAPTMPGTGSTYLYVIKRTGPGTRWIAGGGAGNYHMLFDNSASATGVTFNVNFASGGLVHNVSVLDRWIIIVAVAKGTGSKMVVGNEAAITGNLDTANGIGITLGASGGGSGYGTFDLAKYRGYDRVLTDAEITQIMDAMRTRYALA